MALSEHEQRLLDQLEASLAADDPRLAAIMRGVDGPRRLHPRRATFAATGFVIGVVGLVGGLQIHPIVSVLGFVVMLLSAMAGLGAWPRTSSAHHPISEAHPSRQRVNAPKLDPHHREPGSL